MEAIKPVRKEPLNFTSDISPKQHVSSLLAVPADRDDPHNFNQICNPKHEVDDWEAERNWDNRDEKDSISSTSGAPYESFNSSLIENEKLQKALPQENGGCNIFYAAENYENTLASYTKALEIASKHERSFDALCHSTSSAGFFQLCDYDGEDECLGISETMGASPSAPPMMGSVSIDSEDESISGPSVSQAGPQIDESILHSGSPVRLQQSLKGEAEQITETRSPCEQTGRHTCAMEGDEATSMSHQTVTPAVQHPPLCLSGHAAWQVLIAYDACVRLCLRAWAKGCMEAPDFLLNECLLLRNSFGLQHLLLQPQEDPAQNNLDSDSGTDVASISKPKGNAGRIKVQVRKIRIFPRQAVQGYPSLHSPAYIQAGAKYVRQMSDVVITGVKSFLNTTLEFQEMYSCLLWLKGASTEEGVLAYPGSGDMHVFNLESSSDNLLLEVQDSKGHVHGQGVVQLSSLFDDQNDRVRWWPIFSYLDHECVGKVQLFIRFSANLNEDSSKKCGPVGETLAYNIVLEAAMRSQFFQRRNLRLHGAWKWLLSEFAILYGVSNAYTSLRYLACTMEVATPTEDCLVLIHDLLSPLIIAQNETVFTRQEKRMLSDVIEQVDQLLACVFENYKFLDESSVSGISDMLALSNTNTAPALVPAVKIFTLLHDILSVEAQKTLSHYFQRAAKKRCRRLMAESDEFVSSSNEGFLMDSMTTTMAYSKLKALCVNMCNEVQADIELHNEHILPSCIDLPNITADVYCMELSERLRNFLVACPPSGPSPHVVELLIATADFQQKLTSWKISPSNGRVDAKDLFHLYVVLWVQERRLSLLDSCKADKMRWTCVTTPNGTSSFVEELYDRIKDTLSEYDSLLNFWPEYTLTLEAAMADVETAVVTALEKQYADALAPLKDVMVTKKFTLQYMQKLTRRRSLTLYTVPNQLGTFLNTIKRLLDTLRPKIDVQIKSWAACISNVTGNKMGYGERSNEVTIFLRAKYKNFIQAIVEKLSDNARLQATTKLKKILQDTREAGGETEIRDRMQPLNVQLLETITRLHDVFTPRVFVAICRGYWDRMGQEVLQFLENRKENRLWYKGFSHALTIIDDVFSSQMQKLQGHCLQEKDLDPPRSIMEARSMLSRDAPNCLDSSSYLYF
ncbi:hypothetical protein GOP47_0006270 [Adiantum capillus-veneris]|uniref:Uncharacterized protein n=1 Tax=Adiantum capillus-veneris TaxID=13818 RepID=A0A9D4V2K0_ADICA|nr:hypothetical protein GOP47_0006270 [Adiantum capillus-veneris]